MHSSPDSIRKAAVLVATLDPQTADALLDQMTPAEADLVRRAAVAIDVIDSQEQEAVIREFLGRPAYLPPAEPAGVELDGPLLRKLAASNRRDWDDDDATHSGGEAGKQPFRFLHQADCEQLTPFLEGEHPQTIAVVASHLPPERAAQLIAPLPASLQAEVLRRLVNLEEMHPDILRDLERGLESRIAQLSSHKQRRTAGLTAVANILSAAEGRLESRLLENLAQHSPQLARQLERPVAPLEFKDLMQLDLPTLIELLREVDPQVVTLALAGSEPAFVDRVLAAVPRGEADRWRAAWRNLGPTQLSDVDTAQQELVTAALRLEREGRMRIPRAWSLSGGTIR